MEKLSHALNAGCNRRDILKGGLSGMLGVAALSVWSGSAKAGVLALQPDNGRYAISFRNVHTNEAFSGTYRVGNKYLPDAFTRINSVLRDFRTGDQFPIDPRVIDVIWTVRERAGSKAPYDVLSGYRSPKTNAMLRKTTAGVAQNSLHMVGQAIDVHLPDLPLAKLRDTAMKLRAGGVGYYPESHFVHMDTGQVRHWAQDPNNT